MDTKITKDTNTQVYEFICAYISQHGYSPSFREIARGCFISVTAVLWHLMQLESLGLIEREARVARSITVKKRAEK